MTYSMDKEDDAVIEYFSGKVGNFLDIGAIEGKYISNTWLLSQKGWGGVLVEPNYGCIADLIANYKGNDKVRILNAAVAGNHRISTFWACIADRSVSTMVKEIQDVGIAKGNERASASLIHVATVTVKNIHDAFPMQFDFVNIDAEGVSMEILESFSPSDIGCSCVCVEISCEDDRLRAEAWMTKHGWHRYRKTIENYIMVKA